MENVYYYQRWWGEYLLGSRRCAGSAAQRNRGRYSGQKSHIVIVEEVIGLAPSFMPSTNPKRQFAGEKFWKTGVPQYFSAHPWCGCCQGQHAASETKGLAISAITCTKCQKSTIYQEAVASGSKS